ncbi:hypothetical protein, partial [Fructobacillus tropaeoli]|uniref:hypothetical protein n=1 Tax=Fructobacillus tropaeoli TaxID=709323 RepID=UPI001A9A53E8
SSILSRATIKVATSVAAFLLPLKKALYQEYRAFWFVWKFFGTCRKVAVNVCFVLFFAEFAVNLP